MGIDDVLRRLAAAERDFVAGGVVLAPVLRGRGVAVRIAGIVCTLSVDVPTFEGWAILQPLATDQAHMVRPATLTEVRAYLRLFPAVGLIALAPRAPGRTWLAAPAHRSDRRFQLPKVVPAGLVEEGTQPFDTIVARYDGRLFWYERRDGRRNPALAAYLREAFSAQIPPADLRKSGLSAEERAAYALHWEAAAHERRDADEARLADALAHAGARLVAYVEREDSYTVAYTAGATRHVSVVAKGDLTVLTAGICLDGHDRDFDLTSLVGVLREAEGRGAPRWQIADGDEEE